MFQKITIENFIRIPYLDLTFRKPAVLIAGPNEAGKTSFAEALRFVLLNELPRVKYNKDLASLVTNGAKRGMVELTFNNFSVRRNILDAKASGDTDALPTDTIVASIALGASTFASLDDAERRNLVMRLMGVELTPAKITAELEGRGFTKEQVNRYKALYSNGLDAAADKANRLASESRGAWQEVTGERYGTKKAKDWQPHDPGIKVEELQESIAALDGQIAAIIAKRDEELLPVMQQIREMNDAIHTPNGKPCPACGVELVYNNGNFAEYKGLTPEQKSMKEKLVGLQVKRRDSIKQEYENKLNSLQLDKSTLVGQIAGQEARANKIKRAAEIQAEIEDAEKMRELFGSGPDGILARAVAKAIGPLNVRLAEVAAAIGWQAVTLGGDMTIQRVDQVPYFLLSESAQWRADMMLHAVLGEYACCPWLVLDRLDVLDPLSRVQFIKWVGPYAASRPGKESTVIALATLKEPPQVGSLPVQVEWLEAGQLAEAAA